MTNDEFKIYKAKVARKHASLTRIKKEFLELVAQCTHNELRHKKEHEVGGYLNTGTNTEYDECILCGKKFNVVETSTGIYG
jgi:hypothetical protein